MNIYRESPNGLLFDLLWGFADPVMWFIRVLIPLYVIFYLYSILSLKYGRKNYSWMLLIGCIVFSILSIIQKDSIVHHSVPMFALGIVASYYKDRNVCVLLICLCGVPVSLAALATTHPITGLIHCYFDYVIIALLLIFTSKYHVKIKLPAVLAAIIFDIYLVHFKLLEIGALFLPLKYMIICILPMTLITALCFMKFRTTLLDNEILHL